MQHIPVLLGEMIDAIETHADGEYVDATFGRGGHSAELLRRLGAEARLLVVDRDPQAVEAAHALAARDARVTVASGRFSEIAELSRAHHFQNIVGIMMDIGVSSPQLDEPGRGFSFLHDGPLDMRMDNRDGMTAAEWLEAASTDAIADVLWRFGEERFAVRIARAISRALPVATTAELARVIAAAVPRPKAARRGEPRRHPATRSFQALRIVVNDELGELDRGLEAAFAILLGGGRLGAISFHSLEHRLIRRRFRHWVRGETLPRRLPVRGTPGARARYVVKQRRPSESEAAANPRARSALLQVVEKLA